MKRDELIHYEIFKSINNFNHPGKTYEEIIDNYLSIYHSKHKAYKGQNMSCETQKQMLLLINQLYHELTEIKSEVNN